MSSWNYRIILHDTDADPERHWFALHEVFYGLEDGIVWTENPITFVSDDDEGAAGIIWSLGVALRDASKHPILRESNEATWPIEPSKP